MDKISEIRDIYEKQELLQQKITKLYEIKASQEELNQAIYQLYLLKATLSRLERDAYLEMDPTISGNRIDLYLKKVHMSFEENPSEFECLITLHNTKKVIGEIQIRFYAFQKYLGNIGANIQEEYRGNHYVKDAYILLHDVMLERGLTRPVFTVKTSNISSIHCIQSLGAYLVGEGKFEDKSYYIYEDNLEKEKDKRNKL